MGHRNSSSVSLGSQKLLWENLQSAESIIGQEESATHAQVANSSASGGGNDSGNCGDASQRLDAERVALLRSKQAELDAIEDRHDDLVRFLFLRCVHP